MLDSSITVFQSSDSACGKERIYGKSPLSIVILDVQVRLICIHPQYSYIWSFPPSSSTPGSSSSSTSSSFTQSLTPGIAISSSSLAKQCQLQMLDGCTSTLINKGNPRTISNKQ